MCAQAAGALHHTAFYGDNSMCLEGCGTVYYLAIRSKRGQERDWRTIQCVVALMGICSPLSCQIVYTRI